MIFNTLASRVIPVPCEPYEISSGPGFIIWSEIYPAANDLLNINSINEKGEYVSWQS